MRLFFYTSFLVLFCCTKSFSQQTRFTFGIHSGGNLNTARGKAFSNAEPDNNFGLNIGLDVEFKLSKSFSLKAMPQIDRNGWAFKNLLLPGIPPATNFQKGSAVTRLIYLNLPVTANHVFGNKIRYHFGAGVFGGVLLNEKLTIQQKVTEGALLVASANYTNNYKRFNFGLAFNAGAQLPLTKSLKLNLGVLENFGLANINKKEGSIKTNSLSGIIGVVFQPR